MSCGYYIICCAASKSCCVCNNSPPPVSSHWAAVHARLLGQWIHTFSWCPVLIPVGETKVNPLWLCGPARCGWRGARPHKHAKIRGKRDMKTIRLLSTRLALGPGSWSCNTSESGVALERRQDTPELAYGLGSHRARCGEAVVNR